MTVQTFEEWWAPHGVILAGSPDDMQHLVGLIQGLCLHSWQAAHENAAKVCEKRANQSRMDESAAIELCADAIREAARGG